MNADQRTIDPRKFVSSVNHSSATGYTTAPRGVCATAVIWSGRGLPVVSGNTSADALHLFTAPPRAPWPVWSGTAVVIYLAQEPGRFPKTGFADHFVLNYG